MRGWNNFRIRYILLIDERQMKLFKKRLPYLPGIQRLAMATKDAEYETQSEKCLSREIKISYATQVFIRA